MLKYFVIAVLTQVIHSAASSQNIRDNAEVSQPDSYQAIKWNIDQGISRASVNCMIKDVNGFLWIGTSFGLARFDGSRFINYLSDKNKRGSINDNHILSLVEDSIHNLWMGTFKGLSRYDLKADTFSNFFPPVDSTLLAPYTIPFWATGNEVFCIEMYNRITAYNIHSFKRRVIVEHFKNDWLSSLLSPARSVLDERNNCIWMPNKSGILQVSLSGKQIAYTFPASRKIKFDGYALIIADMCFDKSRNIIWQNTSDGLMQFSITDKKFYCIRAFDKLVNEKPNTGTNYYMPAGRIGLDVKQRLWLATKPKGTLIYDPETHAITQPLVTSLHGNILQDAPLYFGCDGIIWLARRKEIVQLNPIKTVSILYSADSTGSSLSSNHIATILNGPQGNVWIGTWDGINIFNPRTNSFQVLRQKDLSGFHGKNIMPLAMDSSLGTTWLKGWAPDALYEMDIPTKKCWLVTVNDTTTNHKFDMAEIQAELATAYKNGFIFFMPRVGIFSVKKDSLIARPMIPFLQFIIRMIVVENHLLFVRTYNDAHNFTYVEENGKWHLTSNILDSIPWANIYFNKDDNTFWVGTIDEIIHYDKNFHRIHNYADGFPGHEVIAMLTDNLGNLWFVNGSNAISRLNTRTGQFLTLSEKDGFEKENIGWYSVNLKDTYGNLYFACENGFYKINPAKFRDHYPPSSAYIQSISINQKPFTLPATTNNVQKLTLNYSENNIAIEAGIIDYYSAGASRIRYKLDGVTSNWQYGSNQSIINFNGLQPGNYKLIMQASNAVNEFNGSEKILWIYINAAWWQTWWFFTIAVLTAGVALYGLIRWRLHQQFQRRLQQSEKDKQLAELKDKTSQLEMETLRSQMNPHFIFNCLSSINRFILKNKTEEASDYLTKFSRLIRMVLNNSKREFISLEDELETLRLYLEMERLRFKNSFDYSFTYKNSVDVGNIFIPPLLLQPFAENAIWHGLMHKQEKGFLNFDFSTEENFLTCTITDNGVGREQAEFLKSKSAEKQKSMGLKITTERLSILNNNANEQTFFTIEDLADENGNAVGTRVHLKIYYKEMSEV